MVFLGALIGSLVGIAMMLLASKPATADSFRSFHAV